jgi:hypothetical protein
VHPARYVGPVTALALLSTLVTGHAAAPGHASAGRSSEGGIAELRAWASAAPGLPDLPEPVARYHAAVPALGALADVAASRPGAIRVEEIGRTARDRPIWAFTFAEPRVLVGGPHPAVPVEERVLVFAGIHALEWISTEAALALCHDLAAVPPRGVAVTVIPVLNVDGRLRAEADARAGRNAYRRGNGARPPVDLNRDFAVHHEAVSVWRHILPGYHASSGSPLSQPESRALDALAARERFDRAASLHAFGGYFYTPWAGRWRRADDHAEMVAIGREMERAQGPHAYRTRQLSRWGFFFRANGAEIDHLYGEYGTRAFLIEITRSGFDLRHPIDSVRTYLRWYNPARPTPHVERTVAALKALVEKRDR